MCAVGGSTELVSPCLAPEYSGSWEHADVVYTVKGQKAGELHSLIALVDIISYPSCSGSVQEPCSCVCVSGEPVYEACLNKVEKILYRKVTKAPEAADMDFYAFSYYYDRAVDLGVIGRKLTLKLMLTTCTQQITVLKWDVCEAPLLINCVENM